MTRRRLRPVRLPDVPVGTRLAAARSVIRVEPDREMRVLVMVAAVAPSNQTYWVVEAAA